MRKIFFARWLLLLLLPLTILFDLSGGANWWRIQVISVISPSLKFATDGRYWLNQNFVQLSLLPQAANQVIILQNEVIKNKIFQAQVQSLQEENAALRQKLSMPPLTQPHKLLTTVISYPDPLVQLPDDGSNLTGGVVLGQGVLLGFIKNTAAGYGSIEVLASDTGRHVLAKTTSGVQGVISYDGKNLVLSAVQRQAQVAPDEMVVTMGQPGVAPNLVIGSIGKTISALSAPTQTLTVIQPVTLYQTRVVEVLKP